MFNYELVGITADNRVYNVEFLGSDFVNNAKYMINQIRRGFVPIPDDVVKFGIVNLSLGKEGRGIMLLDFMGNRIG